MFRNFDANSIRIARTLRVVFCRSDQPARKHLVPNGGSSRSRVSLARIRELRYETDLYIPSATTWRFLRFSFGREKRLRRTDGREHRRTWTTHNKYIPYCLDCHYRSEPFGRAYCERVKTLPTRDRSAACERRNDRAWRPWRTASFEIALRRTTRAAGENRRL